MNPIDEIFELFEQHGGADYGGERFKVPLQKPAAMIVV